MRLAAAAILAVAAILAGACGASSSEQRARDHFGGYREAQEARTEAESALRQVFQDIARAAGERDRAGVLAAAVRGKEALATIYASLAEEIAAADRLAGYGPTLEDGRRLRAALRQTRAGTKLVGRQLDIASRDPFLDVGAHEREISRLSFESRRISVPAALARRRAVRALATTLGVEPPLDVMFDR
jgi:hypothetical protein